jgi:mono/diheme cytochrome c family protein/plastocyanin
MNGERVARLLVIVFAAVLPLAALIVSATEPAADQVIEMRGVMAEAGGWTPSDIVATAGQPIRLCLTSDDVIHGFAVGQTGWPAIDVMPGEVNETTLVFDKPGKYTYYCTRWCGANHWRMRGTIEVVGDQSSRDQLAVEPPPYVTLGLDIDAPHPAEVVPDRTPSAVRGAALGVTIPAPYLSDDYHRSHSPADAWQALRVEAVTRGLSDAQVWDLLALTWQSNSTRAALDEGRRLYAENCAACHGERGAGDGVMAASLAQAAHGDMNRHDTTTPADFTDASSMLGASPALLHGKIVRGGMGTGMPYFGPIFTDAEVWAIIDYLWTFQFDVEEES